MGRRKAAGRRTDNADQRADRLPELVGLLSLLTVVAGGYVIAGPGGFSAVAAAGGGFFAAWRARR